MNKEIILNEAERAVNAAFERQAAKAKRCKGVPAEFEDFSPNDATIIFLILYPTGRPKTLLYPRPKPTI